MAIGQCWAKDDNSEAAVVDEQLTRLVVNASVRGMDLGYDDDACSDRHESTRSASYIPISRCFSHSTPILLWDFPIILDGLIRMSSIESVSVLKENKPQMKFYVCQAKLFIFLCNFQRGLDYAPFVLPVLPSPPCCWRPNILHKDATPAEIRKKNVILRRIGGFLK